MSSQPDFILDGLEDDFEPKVDKTRTGLVLFFHFAFRTAAIVFYIICGFMNNTFVTQSVLLLVLLAVDFWFVKNVSGRILAGLRWWSAVDDTGNAFWVFESVKRDAPKSQNAQAPLGAWIGATGETYQRRYQFSSTFWVSLFAYTVVWCVFAMVSTFTLSFGWLMLCIIAVVLNGSNLFGYVRCSMSNANSSSVFGPLAGAASALRSAVVRRVASNAIANALRRGNDSTKASNESNSGSGSGYRYAPVRTDGEEATYVDFDKPGSNVH